MKINYVTLDNKTRSFSLNHNKKRNVSGLHRRAVDLLGRMFDPAMVYEEIKIFLLPRKKVFFDIFVPKFKMFVEVQGEQHTIFNSFHFKSKTDFLEAQNRDRLKIEWCELNKYKLILLPFNESDDEWTLRI